MAKCLNTFPTFAAGEFADIEPAITDAILPYPSYVYIKDTHQLAFIDKDLNIQIIKGDIQVIRVDELPDIAEGNINVLYIYNNIVYVFTGTEYKPMYSDITIEVFDELEKMEKEINNMMFIELDDGDGGNEGEEGYHIATDEEVEEMLDDIFGEKS